MISSHWNEDLKHPSQMMKAIFCNLPRTTIRFCSLYGDVFTSRGRCVLLHVFQYMRGKLYFSKQATKRSRKSPSSKPNINFRKHKPPNRNQHHDPGPLKPCTIIIIGAGPLMSRSLLLYLASHKWQIILISRSHSSLLSYASEINTLHPEAPKVLIYTGDASIPSSLTEALNWAAAQTGGKVDVLCYNAAHVVPNPLLELSPRDLAPDFNISATGTLVAGQVCWSIVFTCYFGSR